MGYDLTGFDGKVALVTGAGRMRSIGRPIAVELARAGCRVVLTGTGRDPTSYPEDEQRAGWRDIESEVGTLKALLPPETTHRNTLRPSRAPDRAS